MNHVKTTLPETVHNFPSHLKPLHVAAIHYLLGKHWEQEEKASDHLTMIRKDPNTGRNKFCIINDREHTITFTYMGKKLKEVSCQDMLLEQDPLLIYFIEK